MMGGDAAVPVRTRDHPSFGSDVHSSQVLIIYPRQGG
jgi:hypothetical protein